MLQKVSWLRFMNVDNVYMYVIGFRKKLEALAKKKGCELVGKWQRSIINHLYWCVASTPDCNGEVIKAKWLSLEGHIATQQAQAAWKQTLSKLHPWTFDRSRDVVSSCLT